MAHRLLRDTEAEGWERSDFPIICESCLGPNPYVRMTKADYDKECKICTRPFTVFRWRPGSEARFKKTEVCQTCTKAKNVCQVCLLDLEYGLPVQVRDQALNVEQSIIPKSDTNREYWVEQQEEKNRLGIDFESGFGKTQANDTILKLQRTTPYYKRNRAQLCSFYARGECTRGDECPYRHEMPETGPLAIQNMKDRYYGVNDPVAEKMLKRVNEMPSLVPPEDQTVMTLYVGGIDERVDEAALKDAFYAFGEIKSVRTIPGRNCAFVTYTTREAAEKAAESLANQLVIKGLRLKLMWGKPQAPKAPPVDPMMPQATMGQVMGQQQQQMGMMGGYGVPPGMYPPQAMGGYGMYPPQAMGYGGGMMPPGGGGVAAAAYPSQDPQAMGTRGERPQGAPGAGAGPGDGAKA